MYYPEELLAGALAIVLGVALIVAPATIYRLQFFVYGPDTGRRGPYGASPEPGTRAVLVIRLIGVGFLLVAVAIGISPWWR